MNCEIRWYLKLIYIICLFIDVTIMRHYKTSIEISNVTKNEETVNNYKTHIEISNITKNKETVNN